MTILPQQTEGGNYAAERLVGQQVIDPTLAASVDANGWAYHFRRRAEEAEQALEVQTARAQELDQGCSWLADKAQLLEQRLERQKGWFRSAATVAAEYKQGVSDLVRRCQEAESLHSASHERAEHWRKSSKFWLEARNYHDGLREQAEKERDAALAELATLKAERKQEDEAIGPVLRRALNQRDHYARERDDLVKSVLLWSAEAARAQAEVIAVADGAAQLRATILTLADGLHYSQTLEVWVLKGPLGDLLRELGDELRNAS